MIERKIENTLNELSLKYPVVTLTGPRQSGKTTLCRKVFRDKEYVSLENPDTRQFATEDPKGFLKNYPDGAILDEIQRAPDLLSYIQTIVDTSKKKRVYILTGSEQFAVTQNVNQSLAGRTALLKLLPFSIEELASVFPELQVNRLLVSGFYPRIYDENLDPTQALGDYFETYVERDIRRLINIKELSLFQKFVKLCAGRVGQLLNLQNLANETGISHTTARCWMTLLEASYIVFLLQPFHKNISKRLVKSPKLYFFDVGLASYLLGIENERHVSRDPLRGNLFENMIVIEALKFRFNRGRRNNLNFYRDSSGKEVDILYSSGPDIFPVEVKAGETLSGDFFKNLKYFMKLFPDESRNGGGLVYGGADRQERTSMKVVPFNAVHTLLRGR